MRTKKPSGTCRSWEQREELCAGRKGAKKGGGRALWTGANENKI